jgi:hypothetical protein
MKSEDVSKWWIRRFRTWLKKNRSYISSQKSNQEFWYDFLKKKNEPGAGKIQFKSFNKKYVKYLTDQNEFCMCMWNWYYEHGRAQAETSFSDKSTDFISGICTYAEEELMRTNEFH